MLPPNATNNSMRLVPKSGATMTAIGDRIFIFGGMEATSGAASGAVTHTPSCFEQVAEARNKSRQAHAHTQRARDVPPLQLGQLYRQLHR